MTRPAPLPGPAGAPPGGPGLAGRVCVVTGAGRGIGLETARGLAALGGRVVIVSRRRDAGEAALAAVRAAARGAAPDDRPEPAELHLADFASLAEVRRLAADVAARHSCIHVLVNNAGIYAVRRETTSDGFERTLAVNHLAPFLLTNLLLPRLLAAGSARIVTVSSAVHRRAFRLDDLQSERRYHGSLAYAKSKAANLLFAFELARRLEGTGAVSNAVHPGTVDTGLLADAFAGLTGLRPLYRFVRPFVRTPADGARASLFVAASPEVKGVSGCYFEGLRPVRPSAFARDAGAARWLWERSAEWVGVAG